MGNIYSSEDCWGYAGSEKFRKRRKFGNYTGTSTPNLLQYYTITFNTIKGGLKTARNVLEKAREGVVAGIKMTPYVLMLLVSGFLHTACNNNTTNGPEIDNPNPIDNPKQPPVNQPSNAELEALLYSYIDDCVKLHSFTHLAEAKEQYPNREGVLLDVAVARKHADCIHETATASNQFTGKTYYFSSNNNHDEDGRIIGSNKINSFVRNRTSSDSLEYAMSGIANDTATRVSKFFGRPNGTKTSISLQNGTYLIVEDGYGNEVDRFY